MAAETRAFVLDNFREERFQGGRKWPPRKLGAPRNQGRALLVDTGALRRSVRVLAMRPRGFVVGSELPYAAAHNHGLRIRTTANVGAFTRQRAGRSERVRSHTRKINFKMPKRQFIGKSKVLDNRLAHIFRDELKHALK